MTNRRFGFAGLGQMGGPMAANIAAHLSSRDATLSVYDKAGTAARAPETANALDSLDQLAANSDTVFLSLPDAAIDGDRILLGRQLGPRRAEQAATLDPQPRYAGRPQPAA